MSKTIQIKVVQIITAHHKELRLQFAEHAHTFWNTIFPVRVSSLMRQNFTSLDVSVGITVSFWGCKPPREHLEGERVIGLFYFDQDMQAIHY
jgi:hypothetical protein